MVVEDVVCRKTLIRQVILDRCLQLPAYPSKDSSK